MKHSLRHVVLLAAIFVSAATTKAQTTGGVTTATLQTAIGNAAKVLDTPSEYLPDAVTELQGMVDYAEAAVANSQNMTQEQLNTMSTQLGSLTTQVKSTRGVALPAVSTTMTGYNRERGFVHPGMLHTQADFERVRRQIADGNETVLAGLRNLKSNSYSSSSFSPATTTMIVRGGGSGENYINAARSAHAAYMNALMWKLTDNKANANCAVRILNAWAQTCKGIGGDSNYALAAGIYGYEFANAAELMRDYEGWTGEDFRAYQLWMLNVWYPSIIGFQRSRNGTWENSGKWWQAPGHYWSNWGLCNDLALISIGILCDDVFIYNQGLSYYKYDQCGTWKDLDPDNLADGYVWSWGLTEYIGNLIPVESDCPDGLLPTSFGKMSQMQESGRDQGHCTLSIGLATDICQTLFNQGDDAWALLNDRLAGGIEHVAAYNCAGEDNVPFVKYIRQSNGFTVADGRGGIMTGTSSASRGQVRPYWAKIIGYYKGLRGVEMPYSEIALKAMGIDGGGSGGASGGYDHLGYSSLMFTRDAVDAGHAIMVLRTSITQDGNTIAHNELGGLTNTFTVNTNTCVKTGTELTLNAALPEGAQDNGTWMWDSGETTPSISITASGSQLHRVTYTAANGVKSCAAFSIAVEGNALPTTLTPTVTYNDNAVTDSTIRVLYGQTVTLTVTPACGWGTFRWSTGQTTQSITTAPITTSRTVTAYYINQGAVVSAQTFHIEMEPANTYIIKDGDTREGTEAVVEQGDPVTLGLTLSPVINTESVEWSDGSHGSTLHINGIQTSMDVTATFELNGETVEIPFSILASSTEMFSVDMPGNYIISHAATGRLLTTHGKNKPATFDEGDMETPDATQQWFFRQNETTKKYDITNKSDSLRLTASGKSSTLSLFPFLVQKAVGKELYAIFTGLADYAGSRQYWNAGYDGRINTAASTTLEDFPFVLTPVKGTDDGIGTPSFLIARGGNPCYDLTGKRLPATPAKGLYISNGKKYSAK